MKILAVVLLAGLAFGQDSSAAHLRAVSRAAVEKMPSDAELNELFNKAEEKVATFRKAVNSARPQLDKIDAHLASNYIDAAATANAIIAGLRTKGPSGAGLLMLITTLDDLALDATQGGLRLLVQNQTHPVNAEADTATVMSVMSLSTAEVGCNDISELLVHASLRFIGAEDSLLAEIAASPQKPEIAPTK